MSGKAEICGVNTARLKVLTREEMDTLVLQGNHRAAHHLLSRKYSAV